MTRTRYERHRRLLALAFAFASTCISFATTVELLNFQPGRAPVFLESSVDTLDI